VNSITDSFGWPLQDPGWTSKILVQGLITIIPIIGWIATLGWFAITVDNYRAGRKELAPYGFHLERGIWLFLVYFIYSLVFSLPGIVLGAAAGSADNNALAALGNLINFVLRLALYFLTPAIILMTYRNRISGGFDFSGIWQLSMSNTGNTVVAALMIFVANLIGGVGIILCCVGIIFTLPYSVAVVAGIVAWYEKVMGSPSPLPPAQPA
jgi:hypothetical protein